MVSRNFKRKLSAILNADVAGYCCLMHDDEEETLQTLNRFKGILFGLVKEYSGRIVDSPGDNILAEFSSVFDAVKCAIQFQKEIGVYNEELPENRRMYFRIGINTGDIIQEGNGIYGDGVNVAARIESLAEPGGICISRTAYDQVKKKVRVDYEYLGEFQVKNLDEPVRIYKVPVEYRADEPQIQENLIKKATVKTTEKAFPKKPSIAVLPFINLSSDFEQEHFVDGLSEEILNRLSHLTELRVIARTSSFSFKNSRLTIQEIANVLCVDNILEGSVRKSGKSLRISAQLIKGSDGSHLWSETYKRELKDIFDVQEEIAITVAHELRLSLGIKDIVQQSGGTDNIEAYELYLTAQGQIWKGNSFLDLNLSNQTLGLINKAITLDNKFALAWAAKSALHHAHLILRCSTNADAEKDLSLSAAEKTIELAPNLADGYSALGVCEIERNNWIGAEKAFQKALERRTGTVSRYNYLSLVVYYVLGDFERSRKILEDVRIYDPLNPILLGEYLYILGLMGDVQKAEKEYQRGRELFGDNWFFGNERITLLRLGLKDAISHDKILNSTKIFNAAKQHLNSPEEGLKKLRMFFSDENNLNERNLTDISVFAAYYGDAEFAMEAIEKGIQINGHGLFKIWAPVMKEVRKLPRFKEYVREIGLVDYWKTYGWPYLCHPVGDDDFECD